MDRGSAPPPLPSHSKLYSYYPIFHIIIWRLFRLKAFTTEAELDQRSKAKKEKTVPDRGASLYDAWNWSVFAESDMIHKQLNSIS